MATEVVNSYNWFLDTERCLPTTAKGDDTSFPLASTPITCADNQYIRMTLQSFSCYKNFYNVNPNNNKFRIILPPSGTPDVPTGSIPAVEYQGINYLTIPCGNYPDKNSIALAFARTVARFLQLVYNLNIASLATDVDQYTEPRTSPPRWGPETDIFYTEINFGSTVPPTSSVWLNRNLIIQANVADGDFFELLGVNRVTDPNDITTGSFALDRGIGGALGAGDNILKIRGLYPMQLSTQQNIYLRTNLTNTNIETESFVAGNTDTHNAHMQSSPILGRIIIDNEFCVFTAETQLEYFVNVAGKQLSYCRLYLTDSHGREIPQAILRYEMPPLDIDWRTLSAPDDYVSIEPLLNTPRESFVGGGGTIINDYNNKQKTEGNFSYEGVIKIDIVQYLGGQNNVLKTERPVKTIPPRFGTEPLNNLDYGKSGYPDEKYARRLK